MGISRKRRLRTFLQALMTPCVALLPLADGGCSESLHSAPDVGDEYEISKRYETSERTSDGSTSGSSRGRDVIVERVIGVREDGLELEFDLPRTATAEDRARSWQFPARIFRTTNGSMRLLNRAELEVRIDAWLEAAGWTREACGRWIFTWNAFRIECDPDSVIKMLEAFDLRLPDIRDGATYHHAEARSDGALRLKSAGPDGATFGVIMEVDPDAVRRARAEADVALGEMMQKPVTLDAALGERAKERVSGTISVTLDADSAGNVWRRTEVIEVDTAGSDSRTESRTVSETVERRPVSGLRAIE